jgi:hypothetical protein
MTVGVARASLVTGDPASDGWTSNGNSLALGTYVRTNVTDSPSNLFNFDVYSTSFNLQSGSSLLSTNWLVGDQIVGIGATINPTAALDTTVRIVTKYGTSAATYAASTYLPTIPGGPYGDGNGSGGSGGTGGINMATRQMWVQNSLGGTQFTTANEGQILVYGDRATMGDDFDRVGDVSLHNVSNDYGRIIYQLGTSNLLSSFETYLNVSLLTRNALSPSPAAGDLFILSLQKGDSYYTDAIGRTPTAAPAAVPEPSSLVLGVLGASGFGLAFLRRSRRQA